MSQFAGKTAIISGGAEGIGLSIATALANENMNVVIADIDSNNLKSAEQTLLEMGASVLALPLDVAVEEQWQTVAEKTLERFGKVHMMVNNAGVGGEVGAVEHNNAKGWQWTLDVNLMGVVYGAKTMVPLMKEQQEGGWIVNVASMAGMGGVPFAGAYTATKTAVVALTEAWAVELAAFGIAVSALCPAFVQTRIHESYRNRQEQYQTDKRPSSSQSAAANKAKHAVENGIDVSIVGKRLVEALNDKELYIFTHPNYRPVTQKRAKLIDEAFERATKSPLLQHILDQKIEML